HESTKGRKHEKEFHSMRIPFVISSFRAFVIGLDGGAGPFFVQSRFPSISCATEITAAALPVPWRCLPGYTPPRISHLLPCRGGGAWPHGPPRWRPASDSDGFPKPSV